MDTKWLADQVAAGKKDKEISEESGVPVHMVAYYRRTALGIDRSPEMRHKWNIDREWLAAQVAAGKSDKQIAAEKGMTLSAVGQYRRRLKIPPRPRAERARVSFSEKYPNGRMGSEAANWRGGRMSTGSGYIRLYMPDHPQANNHGYVYEHRYVMEQKLGRLLEPGELVHHLDRNRSNNAPENLSLQRSRSEHVKTHFAAAEQLVDAKKEIEVLKARVAALEAGKTEEP